MQNKRFILLCTAMALVITISACSSDEFSDDPAVAAQQMDERVDAEAKTLEEAADEAIKIKQQEIDSDTDSIIAEMGRNSAQ